MFDPFITLPVILLLKLMATAGIAAIFVKIFLFDRLRDWLNSRAHLVHENPDHVAVSIHDKLENGQYRTCYGIFDRAKGRFRDGEMLISDHVDAETSRVHRPGLVTVYPS